MILRVFKARIFHTRDSELMFRLLVFLALTVLYLTVWTCTHRSTDVYNTCTFLWPDIVAMTG